MVDYHLLYYYLFNEECKMQKKNETRKMNKDQQIEEMANGYYIENGKIVYFSNMLDGYKDEKSLQEVCNELNNFVKIFDSYCAKIDFLENKKKELEKQLDAKCDKCINRDRKQTVKEFAEWIKDAITDIPFCNQKAYNVFCDMVNEKLKEYEQ